MNETNGLSFHNGIVMKDNAIVGYITSMDYMSSMSGVTLKLEMTMYPNTLIRLQDVRPYRPPESVKLNLPERAIRL
jgi:hypothetical protein